MLKPIVKVPEIVIAFPALFKLVKVAKAIVLGEIVTLIVLVWFV